MKILTISGSTVITKVKSILNTLPMLPNYVVENLNTILHLV
jgi:hypothetical protein